MVSVPQLKILNSVVSSVSVDVMDRLFARQGPPKKLGHDEAVLQDVPGGIGVGVLGLSEFPIATRISDPSGVSCGTGNGHVSQSSGMTWEKAHRITPVLTNGRLCDGGDSGPLSAPAFAPTVSLFDFLRNLDFPRGRARLSVVSRNVLRLLVLMPRGCRDALVASASASVDAHESSLPFFGR